MNATAQRTPDLPCLIIAGTFKQAVEWVEREKCERYAIAMDGANILTMRQMRIVWVGTFYDRNDFLTIGEDVDAMVAAGMVVVDRNEIVNKGRKTR